MGAPAKEDALAKAGEQVILDAVVAPEGMTAELTAEIAKALRKRKGPGRPKIVHKRIAAVVALRIQGYSNAEIANLLRLAPKDIRQLLWMARKNGFSDLVDRVDGQAVPQAVENLNEFLRDKDREFTLETLKGRGIFRNHNQVKTDGGGGGTALIVKIEMPQLPAGVLAPQIAVGQVVGAPRRIEPQIIEGSIADAVQVEGSTIVDVGEPAGSGGAVGEGHAGSPEAAGERSKESAIPAPLTIDEIARKWEQIRVQPK